MSEYKLFVQRIGLVGITNILVAISSLILLPILTKNFSIGEYGIWVQITTTIGLMPNIATLGLPYTMVRFLSAEKDENRIREGFYSISAVVLVSTFIISVLMFIFAQNIANGILGGDVQLAMVLAVIIFFACLNAFLLNYFRTFQQMKRYSIFLLIQTYLGVFIVSYFALMGFSIYTAALGLLAANITTLIVMLPFIISNIGFKIPKFSNMREYLSFGLPTVPSNLSYWITDSSDRYVIGIFLGTAFVGYYSPGYTLGNIIMLILAPFTLLLPSVLPKYYEDNNMEQVDVFLKYSLKYFLLVAIPSAVGLSLLSKPILNILTTTEIAANGYLITPFVALSAILIGIYGITSNILVLEKKTKIIGTVWIICAILNLGLNIIMVPYLGILGAAAVTLISYVVAFSIMLYYSNKFFTFDFNVKFIIKSIISSILIAVIIILSRPEGILNIAIVVVVCAAVYFASIILLKGVEKSEFKFFKNMLNE
ncbi:flippase [Methanobacterium aggregans]|uniref:flippase n=1 Tax=Methanobacterium aggregans TaxID=1615586 RepID=UPI001AE7221E|nr:flippase [Methanobacterium aggregans]MBP2044976.1 O-antigen/teichoic acid export membrane protein [Methanobacterium aggregans]